MDGIKLFEPKVFGDNRGFFMETFREDDLLNLGIDYRFVQDNHSGSVKNTLRGLHFQWNKPQGKLIRVTSGEAIFVEVDLRYNSKYFGKHEKFKISADNKHILWVPPGFANGFLAISDWCEVQYKCTAIYNPSGENAIRWNSEELRIEWNCANPIVSEKDSTAGNLKDWMENNISKTNWWGK
jgi:dTDP-4-dehydrorhamnose 3,5-epimerase